MTILSDSAFSDSLAAGTLLIEPRPTHDRIGTSSIDLLLAGEFKRWKQPAAGMEIIIDPSVAGFSFRRIADAHLEVMPTDEDGSIVLRPGRFVLGRTREWVELPRESNLAARVEGRSSLARCGVGIHVTAPTIHAGWRGVIALEITNQGSLPMRLRPGLPICQLIVERVDGRVEGAHRTSFQNQDTVAGPGTRA